MYLEYLEYLEDVQIVHDDLRNDQVYNSPQVTGSPGLPGNPSDSRD